MDESLVSITANRVGVFRRGKSKAKVVRGAAMGTAVCAEWQQVTLCLLQCMADSPGKMI